MEISRLKDAGAKWGRPEERFKEVGQVDAYEGLYHKLSDSVHSNLTALQNRYLEIQDDKLVVVLSTDPVPSDLEAVQGSTLELLTHLEATISYRFLSGEWKFDH